MNYDSEEIEIEGEEIEKKPSPANNNGSRINTFIRLLAIIFLIGFIITDKILNMMTPPLDGYFYGATLGVILFGENLANVVSTFKK